MLYKLIFSSIITLLILEMSNLLEIQAEHKNTLINKFCIASLKSKLDFKDKQKIDEIDEDNQDLTKWTLVDRIGNVYNRMVIFNAKQYHCSLDYFGTNKENGRLFQVFFFSTEK